MNYNALSLFSSAGVAETYFEKHGIQVKVAAELLPERASFYQHLYPKTNYNILCADTVVQLIIPYQELSGNYNVPLVHNVPN